MNQCFRANVQVKAGFNFEFNDLKIYASLHNLVVEIDKYFDLDFIGVHESRIGHEFPFFMNEFVRR